MRLTSTASSCNGSFYIDPSTKLPTIISITPGSWTTTNNSNRCRCGHIATGTQNAGLIAFGGSNTTEEYNGSTWSETVNSPFGVTSQTGAAGNQNSTLLVYANYSTTQCQGVAVYNGSTWSTCPIVSLYSLTVYARNCRHCGGCTNVAGSYNSGVLQGSSSGQAMIANTTYELNGSAWSATATSPIGLRSGQSSGFQNGASMIGPLNPSTAYAMCYNGFSWSTCSRMNQPRGCMQGFASFNSNNLYVAGGQSCSFVSSICFQSPVTECYDGSTWTTGPNLSEGRQLHGATGASNAGLAAGGRFSTGGTTRTEELSSGGSSCTQITLSP